MSESKIDDGGPAFQTLMATYCNSGSLSLTTGGGMTLLDRVALAIAPRIYGEHMSGQVSVEEAAKRMGVSVAQYVAMGHPWERVVAREAYEFAEAFVAEKRRREGGGA